MTQHSHNATNESVGLYISTVVFFFFFNFYCLLFGRDGCLLLVKLLSRRDEPGLFSGYGAGSCPSGAFPRYPTHTLGWEGFSSCCSWALEHRLSSCGARAYFLCDMWNLPRSGTELVPPSLAGRISATGLLGKPHPLRLNSRGSEASFQHSQPICTLDKNLEGRASVVVQWLRL